MSDATNNNALNAINPLSYMGVNPRTPPNFVQHTFAPTLYDSKNFQIGALWLNTGNAIPPVTPPTLNDLYVLVALYQGQATWLPFTAGDLRFLTGNSGGPVPPTANNINVVGDGTTVTVVGTPGTSTLTISLVGGGVAAQSFPTDSGTATPNGSGVLNVFGDTHNITTTGAGNTIHVGLTGITQHSLQVGGAANALTQLGVASNGQLPIGSVGADPVLATLTAGSGISIVNSPGSITIASSSTPTAAVQFSSRKSADSTNATGDTTLFNIVCDTVIQNIGGGYNGGTGVFTAPISGLYYLEVIVDTADVNASHTIGSVGFANHNFDYNPFNMSISSSTGCSYVCTQELLMTAGDTVAPNVTISGGTKTVTVQGFLPGAGNRGCFFNGFLIGSAGLNLQLHTQDGNNVTPNGSGVVNISGAQGITTTGTVGPNTLTIHPPASSCAFLANKTTASANVTGDGTQYTIVFDHEFFDSGGNYNNATGTFTAPETGIYSFVFCVTVTAVGAATADVDMILTVNGGPQQYLQNNQAIRGDLATDVWSGTETCIIQLTSTDTVQCSVVVNLAAPALTVGVLGNNGSNNDPRTTFAGYRVA